MVERSPDLVEMSSGYTVRTDEEYVVQKDDKIIEVINGANILMEEVCFEGHSFWLIRQNILIGYLFTGGKWTTVNPSREEPKYSVSSGAISTRLVSDGSSWYAFYDIPNVSKVIEELKF